MAKSLVVGDLQSLRYNRYDHYHHSRSVTVAAHALGQMQDPTSELQPSVARIVADALQSAADGLARWLEVPVSADRITTCSLGRRAAEDSLAAPNEILCCCAMPVALAFGSTAAVSASAGQLLMAWTEDGAAKLIDLSLHCHGTPSDQTIWQSLDRSVIAETLNVVGCEFLNAVAVRISEVSATEIALMPSPPIVSRQNVGSLMNATGTDVQSGTGNGTGTETPEISLASGRFHVAGNAIETRFAMVWTPMAWRRLNRLVEGSVSRSDGDRGDSYD